MMRRLSIAGLIFLSFMRVPEASAQSLFQKFYDEAIETIAGSPPSASIVQFVITSMRTWGDSGKGIDLSPQDIAAALADDDRRLCNDKVTYEGREPIEFLAAGGADSEAHCLSLKNDIRSLIEAERQADALGTDLLLIAGSSELAVADEPHRPTPIGRSMLSFTRLWSDAGALAIPWPDTEETRGGVGALEAALVAEDSRGELSLAIRRFHFGLLRDAREADPELGTYGVETKFALETLRNSLNLWLSEQSEQIEHGEFLTPSLSYPNVALWARVSKNAIEDLGIHWIYPTRFTPYQRRLGGEYPSVKAVPDTALAYPFSYAGTLSGPLPQSVRSPLCSRISGSFGYLCRLIESPDQTCSGQPQGENLVSLISCKEREETFSEGPPVCAGLTLFSSEDGTPLEASTVCTPENALMYRDDLTGHACFIATCLKQTLSEHSLVGGRNPIVVFEPTAPFLAAERPDPQLGLYAEAVSIPPFVAPPYLGIELMSSLERAYCAANARAPRALAGTCAFNDVRRLGAPLLNLGTTALFTNAERRDLEGSQQLIASLAATIGQRLATDQSLIVTRRQVSAFASVIENVASLFEELKNAPITDELCPLSGPLLPVPQ